MANENPHQLVDAIAPKLPTMLNERWANELLDAIPDGWAKVDGRWVQVSGMPGADRLDIL